jgi:D-serine deaminase-like pyridoxal phosphate-dependent protein
MDTKRPTLVLNKTRCLQNIELMVEKAKRHKLSFRPHFKTHQSAEIGNWFRMLGVDRITVSSVSMAHYFSNNGWKNITIAIPFNVLEMDELSKFPDDCMLNLLVENTETVLKIGHDSNRKVGIYIEISTGYERTGVEHYAISSIEELIATILPFNQLTFKGLLTHAGHSYSASSKYEVQNIHYDALKKMSYLKEYFSPEFPNMEISMGDTPSCSISENFMGVTEIRPGNFVFYDLKQHSIGACSFDDIALRMHCPVISKQKSRNEAVIYGGSVHFSSDHIRNSDGNNSYGRIVFNKAGVPELLDSTNYVSRLTQEHGIVHLSQHAYEQINIGDILEIIPVHACLTAHSMGRFITNKGEAIEMMPRG